jgi:hypothetical protein
VAKGPVRMIEIDEVGYVNMIKGKKVKDESKGRK